MLLGRALFVLTFLGSFSLIACSPTTTETAATSEPCADCIDAGTEDTPGLDATVLGFDATRFSFTGSENRRTNDIAASFPVAGTYDRITLTLSLACPDQKCDPWDRAGTLGLVVDEGGAGTDDDKVIELARFMTPYGVGGSWTYDLTDLRPLFRGPLKLRAFIDTWVGPGSAYGNGWALTTSIEFHGGIPARTPIAVIPLWQHSVDGSVVVGDPAKPLATSLPDVSVTLPSSTSAVAVRTLVTGHGQGNQGNCAEFCKLNHTTSVGGDAHKSTPWRSDCRTTAVAGQQGTWTLSRAGWCPGSDVRPWTFDVAGLTEAALAGREPIAVHHEVAAYENACRPIASDAGTCDPSTCSLSTGCAYDGANHTEPFLRMSSVLIAYR